VLQTDGSSNRDAVVCRMAREYLLSFGDQGVTEAVLARYLEPPRSQMRVETVNDVYLRLLGSAQNANMRAGVVGGSIGGVENLGGILFDFDPVAVRDEFTNGWEQVLDEIESRLQPRGKIRRTSRSIWPQFCRTIISGASFLAQFKDANDFYAWADVFDSDDRLRPALPLLLSCEIAGYGFPLACDFIKELGYLDFAKPDVHIKAILSGIGLVEASAGDFQCFKGVVSIARATGLSPYHVDKLLWLVGSGFFYDDPKVGRDGRIRTNRSAFIAEVRKELGLDLAVA
jgi:hypothetical protein